MTVEALRWRGDALELLDQRLLPERIAYVTCRDAAQVALEMARLLPALRERPAGAA